MIFKVEKDYRGLTKDIEFNLGFNLTIILDDNGTGKSTLLKGIAKALYSETEIENPTDKDVIKFVNESEKTTKEIIDELNITTSYYGQDSNLKTKSYMVDDDMFLQLSSMKSSSGEGGFRQVLEAFKSTVVLLDEPSTSLSIYNIRKLVKVLEKTHNSKFIMLVDHNETLLRGILKSDIPYKVYNAKGELISIEHYLKSQYEKELNF